ncbi:hypothetical protein [Tardiphaga sp.]|jgi:hypothetical protein|uniref:hypothetical protein n=1 Tax=Tardiphaga sp. TaxID=1926292 RepID=UPI0037DA3A80
MGTVILGPAAAAQTVCHDEQLRIWAHDQVLAALSMGGYLRDDLSYDDRIDMETMVMREIRGIVESAFDHPEARTIRRT